MLEFGKLKAPPTQIDWFVLLEAIGMPQNLTLEAAQHGESAANHVELKMWVRNFRRFG